MKILRKSTLALLSICVSGAVIADESPDSEAPMADWPA